MAANYWRVFGWVALLILSGNGAGGYAASESVDSASAHITVLYDAFGQTSAMQKDWGLRRPGRIWRQAHSVRYREQPGYPRTECKGKRNRSF